MRLYRFYATKENVRSTGPQRTERRSGLLRSLQSTAHKLDYVYKGEPVSPLDTRASSHLPADSRACSKSALTPIIILYDGRNLRESQSDR